MHIQENIFDESLIKLRQRRAEVQGFVSFLHDQVILDLNERLSQQKQEFYNVEIIGPFAEYWRDKLPYKKCCIHEDQNIIPFKLNSKDLIVSALYLHSVNDPIARLVQMRKGLQRNGILFAYAFGEHSLYELRKSFEYAELKAFGRSSPRVSPMADTPTFGGLLRRAGFQYCVSDKLNYSVDYADPMDLLRDLRGMGETNAMIERSRRFLPKGVLLDAMDHYKRNFKKVNLKSKYQATFDIVCLTGWNSKPGGVEMT